MGGLNKTALVLAGGGFTGVVYEIGVLRAIDDLLIDRNVNDFDIYVGTSAGALVSALLANQIIPEIMFQVIAGTHPNINPLKPGHIFGINSRDWLGWGIKFPFRLFSTWIDYLLNFREMTLFDFLWELTEAAPPGIYDTNSIESFVRKELSNQGKPNKFEDLDRELYIVATQLDTGERIIFGDRKYPEVLISEAIAASSALPLLYKPVRINDREFVDGGLRGTASIDIAIEHGATLVICINPMVPLDSDLYQIINTDKQRQEYLSDRGIRFIADQTLRVTGHSGIHYHIKQLRRRHPEVDIILVEPRRDDKMMFFYNLMEYSARIKIAKHGFESATLGMSEDYHKYKNIMSRHGIPITRDVIIEELDLLRESGDDPEVVRKVLEGNISRYSRRRKNDPLCQLNTTLSKLEFVLENFNPMG